MSIAASTPAFPFEEPVEALVRRRCSVRSFTGEPLPHGALEKIETILAQARGPFEAETRFMLLDREAWANEKIKLGTYGVISGARVFLTAAVKQRPRAMEQLGYAFEGTVLCLTGLGLGTCWLAGTFDRGSFQRAFGNKGTVHLFEATLLFFHIFEMMSNE